jgi:hypothetical protein
MALSACRAELARRGFLYPETGILAGSFGHHRLAWELSGDARCEPGSGVAASVMEEIGGNRHDVILSSEDMECAAYDRAFGFSNFIRSLHWCGFEVIVVVYLRNQVDYVRSLYVEMLKHGYPEPFAPFLEEGLEHGVVRWNKRCAPLCYGDLLSRLRDCHGGRIIVRSYDEARRSVVDDFFSVLDLSAESLGVDSEIRVNREIPIEESFRLFCMNRKGEPPRSSLAKFVEGSIAADSDAEVGLSEQSRERIAQRFGRSDRSALKAFGLRDLPMSSRRMDSDRRGPTFSLSDIFSAEFAELATRSAA